VSVVPLWPQAIEPALSQGKHLAELFETLESGQLQALIASGLLTDLRRCAAELDPTKVNRDEFQKVLGLDPSVFIAKMGGANNTDEITAALGFAFNEWITQANFPLKPSETPWEDEIEIVDPGKSFSEEEGLAILKEEGLLRPTYEHGIRFAEQFGKATTSEKKPYVIFLHEAWRDPDRNRRIVYLLRSAGYRELGLSYPGRRFYGRCVLAGVRLRKQPQS
jgi:hypothetical protein